MAIHEIKRGANLAILVNRRRDGGVPMEEALRRADEEGLVIASNSRLSKALIAGDEFRMFMDAFACWSGTMVGYDEPGKPLGDFIEYTDSHTKKRYIFPVPQEHQGKSDIALVTEHPDFDLVTDGKDFVVMANETGAVGFPTENEEWYRGDGRYDVPTVERINRSLDAARFLGRHDKRVGLVARGVGNQIDGLFFLQRVGLDFGASQNLGVVVESANPVIGPEAHTEKGDDCLVIFGVRMHTGGLAVALSRIKADEDRFRAEKRAKITPVELESMLLRLEKLGGIDPQEGLDSTRFTLKNEALMDPSRFEEARLRLASVPLNADDLATIQSRLQALEKG